MSAFCIVRSILCRNNWREDNKIWLEVSSDYDYFELFRVVLLYIAFLLSFFWRKLSEAGLKDSRKGKMPGFCCIIIHSISSFFFLAKKK